MPLKVVPIKLPGQPRPGGVVTLKNRTLSPVAKFFIECVHPTCEAGYQTRRF